MTKNNKLNNQEEIFARDCKLINLKYEYDGYTGTEKWAIITELTEEELWDKYPDVIGRYIPFVLLSIAQGKVIIDDNRETMIFDIEQRRLLEFALAAGAIYQLPRTTLINHMKMEEYMKHLYKVPNTSKYVQKKYVRIGEGSIIYSIGHHRFIEMARAAGAVYKINEGTGGTVLISLDIFDDYMEQFRESPVPMKNPLWKESET